MRARVLQVLMTVLGISGGSSSSRDLSSGTTQNGASSGFQDRFHGLPVLCLGANVPFPFASMRNISPFPVVSDQFPPSAVMIPDRGHCIPSVANFTNFAVFRSIFQANFADRFSAPA